MWYAIYRWSGETGWKRQNVFEDNSPDLARSMALLEHGSSGSVALVESDRRESAESFPQFGRDWRRLPI